MVDEEDESLEGPEERRRHDRSRLIVDVFFDGNDATGVASTKDISVGGFYLNTQANLPEGAGLLVRSGVGNVRIQEGFLAGKGYRQAFLVSVVPRCRSA